MIELLVTMPIALIVIGGLTFTLVRTNHWGQQVQEQSAQQTDARALVSTFVSDLRQAYFGTGAPIASGFTSTSLTFYSPDRMSPFHLRKISYRLSGQQFQRSSLVSSQTFVDPPPNWTFPGTAGWVTLLPLVTNSDIFTYYDASGAVYTGTDPAQVLRVDIKLTASTGGQQPRITTYTASAVLRGTNQ
jgi:hypothetical protein